MNIKNQISIVELIIKSCNEHPDSIAVQDDIRSITYRELWEESGRLANYLIGKNLETRDVVGICMERSVEVLVSIIAVMRCGGVFTLLDNYLPTDRISYIVSDSQMKLILANGNKEQLQSLENVTIVDLANGEYKEETESLDDYILAPEDLIYILYTSGSTGRPKGVEITGRGVSNYISWAAKYYCNNEPATFPLYSSIGFDLTITSIFVPLVIGGKIVVFRNSDIDVIRKVVKHEEIDVIKMTPTHMNMLSKRDIEECHARKFILGGEALKVVSAKNIHVWSDGKISIYNEYGPTEATVGCMIYKYDYENDNRECVPIGVPIDKTGIFVLDKNMRPVPFNIPGEIYIGGAGLARGYRNLPDATKEKFVNNPFKPNSMLYKSGDLARVLPNRIIEYIGRMDDQVKIRGYRIELDEIENVLMEIEDISSAAAIVKDSDKIVAFVQSKQNANTDFLKKELAKKLPAYMVPNFIIQLDELPVTINGKTDKKVLSNMDISVNNGRKVFEGRNSFERKLVSIWKDILHVGSLGIDDNFFDIGGNSLMIVQLAGRIEEELVVDCAVSELFAYPTIASYCEYKFGNETDKTLEEEVEKAESADDEIAIVGIGAILPSGDDIEEFFDLLSKQYSFIRSFPANRKYLVDEYLKKEHGSNIEYLKGAYLDTIEEFDAEFFGFSPKEADVMDPNQRLFMETCYKALEDAGYLDGDLYGTKTGVYVGYGAGGNDYRRMAYAYNKEYMSSAMQGTLPAIIPARISYLYNLKGPALCIDTACSSSLVALHYACKAIRDHECDQAIIGSVKINMLPINYGVDMGISSPDSITKTFDNGANGTVGGEGAISLFLKPLQKSLDDKDKVYAVIKGSAINQDGKSNGITAPNPIAQTEVIKAAWKDARVEPESISYVEAHGTGTKLGDPIEILGIDGAFSSQTSQKQLCGVGSVKSNIGHLDHAAGMVSVLKTALCLKHKKLVPTANFQYPNEAIDFINSATYINREYRDWSVSEELKRRAGVSGFGLSGTNAHIIMEEAPKPAEDNAKEVNIGVLTITAKSIYSFERLLISYNEILKKAESFDDIVRICNMSNVGRAHYKYRMAIVFKREADNSSINIEDYKNLKDQPNIYMSSNLFENTESGSESEEKVDALLKDCKDHRISLEDFYSKALPYYVEGCNIKFKDINEKIQKVDLPHYPFKKNRHWVNVPMKSRVMKENLLEVSLNNSPAPEKNKGKVILLSYDNDSCNSFIESQFKSNNDLIKVILDNDIYDKLLEISWDDVAAIVHIGGLTATDFDLSSYGLVQAVNFASRSRNNISVYVITRKAYGFNEDSSQNIICENRMLLSLLKTASVEYPSLRCIGLDVDYTENISSYMDYLSERTYFNGLIRNQKCYETVIDFDHQKTSWKTSLGRENGVYVIWGGTGNIGQRLASFLSSEYKDIHIVLIGRKNVFEGCKSDKYVLRKKQLELLKKNYPHIEIMSGDVTNEEDVRTIIGTIKKRYNKIDGIYFCATDGVGKKGYPLKTLDRQQFLEGIKSKTLGLKNLEKVLAKDELEYLVLFSSLITSTGAYGDSSYAASNAYLDAYATKDSCFAKKVITINWPTWLSTIDEEDMEFLAYSQLIMPVYDQEAFELLSNIVQEKESGRYIVGQLNTNPVMLASLDKAKINFSQDIIDTFTQTNASAEAYSTGENIHKEHSVELVGRDNNKYSSSEETIGNVVGNVLGYKQVDVLEDFVDMGANSILLVQIQIELEKKNIQIDEAAMSRCNNIYSLAKYIDGLQAKESTDEKDEAISNNQLKRVFYKNCYYNALFYLLEKHGRRLEPFLANDIFCYLYSDFKITMDTLSFEDEVKLLKEQNVTVKHSDALSIDEIADAVQLGNEVILWIDSYYDKHRTDTYMKEHLLHSVIVSDYRKDEGIFKVIDHSGKDNMDYKPVRLKWDELDQCILGARDKSQELKDCIFTFNDYTHDSTKDYGTLLVEHWKECKKKYSEAISEIDKFANYLGSLDSIDEKIFNSLLFELNEIVRYKGMDVYRIQCLFGEGSILTEARNIHEEWKLIRNRFQRVVFLKQEYSSFNHKKYVDNIRRIEGLETQFINTISEYEIKGAS